MEEEVKEEEVVKAPTRREVWEQSVKDETAIENPMFTELMAGKRIGMIYSLSDFFRYEGMPRWQAFWHASYYGNAYQLGYRFNGTEYVVRIIAHGHGQFKATLTSGGKKYDIEKGYVREKGGSTSTSYRELFESLDIFSDDDLVVIHTGDPVPTTDKPILNIEQDCWYDVVIGKEGSYKEMFQSTANADSIKNYFDNKYLLDLIIRTIENNKKSKKVTGGWGA